MRFWQKVFLVTLLSVIIGINSVSYVILTNGFKATLKSAKDGAELYTTNVTTKINGAISDKQLRDEVIIIPNNECNDIVNVICKNSSYNEYFVDYDFDSVTYCGLEDENSTSITKLFEDEKGNHFINSSQNIYIEGKIYRIKIIKDITPLFNKFENNLNYVTQYGTGIGLAISLILLVLIKLIMRPIQQINEVTKEIAGGNYQKRIEIKGKGEISELAENMNLMAEDVEKNVNNIVELAENRRVFIANMTHELKTPLTSILGFSNIMKIRENLSGDERRKYSSIIENEAKRLKDLSSKLMELISIGNTTLELKPRDIYEVLYEVSESISMALTAKDLSLELSAKHCIMNMDDELMKSLIYNIIDNAIKASAPNTNIQVRERIEKDLIIIEIIDEGMGIPKDKLKHVTEAFYMGDKARSRKAGGAGIGLALCLAICEAHAGTMRINSTEDVGTTITLIFPISGGDKK